MAKVFKAKMTLFDPNLNIICYSVISDNVKLIGQGYRAYISNLSKGPTKINVFGKKPKLFLYFSNFLAKIAFFKFFCYQFIFFTRYAINLFYTSMCSFAYN